MIVIVSALAGAIVGWITARKRKGSGFDIAQYVAIYAIAFGLLGMIATVVIDRVIAA